MALDIALNLRAYDLTQQAFSQVMGSITGMSEASLRSSASMRVFADAVSEAENKVKLASAAQKEAQVAYNSATAALDNHRSSWSRMTPEVQSAEKAVSSAAKATNEARDAQYLANAALLDAAKQVNALTNSTGQLNVATLKKLGLSENEIESFAKNRQGAMDDLLLKEKQAEAQADLAARTVTATEARMAVAQEELVAARRNATLRQDITTRELESEAAAAAESKRLADKKVADQQKALADAQRAEENALASSKRNAEVRNGLFLGSAGALAVFGGAAVVAAAQAGDLEMAVTRLQMATESSAKDFPILKDAVVDLGIHSMYSSTEAAQAFERLAEMGFSVQQVLYGMSPAASSLMDGFYRADEAAKGLGRSAMAVGEAMKTDAVSGAELLGAALNTFKSQGMEASHAADLLVGAFYNGVPSASELGDAITMAGGMANAAGVKFQDFLTTLSLLRQAGMSGSEAGASLRYTMQSLTAPTDKQARALADLGIRTVDTGAKFQEFEKKLRATGVTGQEAIKGFDGSVASLKEMYKAAQTVGLVSLDTSFNQWAEGAGVLKDKLFDSQGGFLGLKNAVDVLDKAMADKNLSLEQKMDLITQLFNVRSGRAATILLNLGQFDTQYSALWDRIGNVNSLGNAQKVMSTFQGSLDTFKDSLLSTLAEAAMPWIKFGAQILKGANDMLDAFNKLGPGASVFLSVFLLLGTVISGGMMVWVALNAVVTMTSLSVGVLAGTFFGIIGVALVVAGVVALLVTHWKDLQNFFMSSNPWLVLVKSLLAGIGIVILANVIPPLIAMAATAVSSFLAMAGAAIAAAVPMVLAFLPFIAIAAVVGLVIAGVVLAIQHWGQITQWFGNLWHTVFTAVGSFFSAVGTRVHQTVNAIGNAIQAGFNFVKGIVEGAIKFVVGLFEWLYNHNYYFQMLVDSVVGNFNRLRAMVSAAVSFVVSFVEDRFNTLKNNVTFVWNLAVSIISGILDRIKTIVSSGFNAVVNTARSMWDQFTGVIRSAASSAGSAAQGVLDAIKNIIQGGISAAFQWGKNLIGGFVDGIKSMAGAAKDAAGSVMSGIGKFLGFHSPSEEGPGRELDLWGPNLIKGFAEGMLRSSNLASGAALSIMRGVAGAFSTPAMAQAGVQYAYATSNVSSGSGTVVIPVHIGGKKVQELIYDPLTKSLKQNGFGRKYR